MCVKVFIETRNIEHKDFFYQCNLTRKTNFVNLNILKSPNANQLSRWFLFLFQRLQRFEIELFENLESMLFGIELTIKKFFLFSKKIKSITNIYFRFSTTVF